MTVRRHLLLFGLLAVFMVPAVYSLVIWSQLIQFARTGILPECLPIPHRVRWALDP